MPRGALAGIRVLDLSTHLSGPYCAMLLGDMGADVIKVERPEGDEARTLPPFVDARSVPFDCWNRNKRGIRLDTCKPADMATLRALIAQADVVVENFRPGVLDRIGLGWEELRAAHPRLILASITGFGRDGPLAGHGAMDLMVQGLAGLMAANGAPHGDPQRLPIPVSDLAAGLHCCIGILGALMARMETGRGQRVGVSLFASAMSMGVYEAAHALALGTRPERMGQAHRSLAPYQAFRAADGWMTVGAAQPQSWSAFCGIIDMLDLLRDPRFATNADRVSNATALVALVSPRLAMRPRADWLALFQAAGIPAEPILAYDEALAHPQAAAIGLLAALPAAAGLRQTLATPFELSETPPSIRMSAPALDEHGSAIRAALMDGPPGAA
jgi:crotonobetainyl-CoA:carnitine CoA-transferase CaiB-like acyl-CoA transferase